MVGIIADTDAGHIFRRATGHVADTPANRALLIDTLRHEHFLGTDRFGNSWYGRILDDGQQVWILCREDRIRNGGINQRARVFHPLTGLSKSES